MSQQVEPEGPVRGMPHPDAAGGDDVAVVHPPSWEEPQRRSPKIVAVQVAGDPESLTEPPGARRERLPPAPVRHDLATDERVQSSNQYGRRVTLDARHDVEAPVHAVDEVDVRYSGGGEHGVVSRGAADSLRRV